nr:reverse transcriptase domain-containing protein [Tanacetum cinerariifolium]
MDERTYHLPPVLTDNVSDKPLIVEAEVEGGLYWRTMSKFTVVRASSPYNIILGRTGMRELRVVSSTVHAMVKFPTPKGIATLIARTEQVYDCRWLERQVVKNEKGTKQRHPESRRDRKKKCSSTQPIRGKE